MGSVNFPALPATLTPLVLSCKQAAVRAALELNGMPLRKRPLRLTRCSLQQQRRVHAQREALATAAMGSKKRQQQQQQPGSKGHRPAGEAARGSHKGDVSWQGMQTKGKAKLRGTKAVRQLQSIQQSGVCGVSRKGASPSGHLWPIW